MDADLNKYLISCCPVLLQRHGSKAKADQGQMARELRLIRKTLPRDHSLRVLAEYNYRPRHRMGWRAFKKWYGKLKEPPGYEGV